MVFVVPSSSSLYISNELRSYGTPLIIVCRCPVPHSSVHFHQEIEDHQQKNDNQKNKKVLHFGHFVENVYGSEEARFVFSTKSTQSL